MVPDWLEEFDHGRLWTRICVSPQRAEQLPNLSDHELQILAGLASGRTYREIAPRLGLKSKTIKNQGLVLLHKASPTRRRADALDRFVQLIPADTAAALSANAQTKLESLTAQDRRALELVGCGRTGQQVGEALGVGGRAGERIVGRISVRLGAPNRHSLAMLPLIAARGGGETPLAEGTVRPSASRAASPRQR